MIPPGARIANWNQATVRGIRGYYVDFEYYEYVGTFVPSGGTDPFGVYTLTAYRMMRRVFVVDFEPSMYTKK
jgi:hypothetical protein